MKIKRNLYVQVLPVLCVLLILSGCMSSTHPTQKAHLGTRVSSAEMERTLEQDGPVTVTTIRSADWAVPLSGLVNLKNPQAAALKEHDEPIGVFAHVIVHPKFGTYLIDTGVSEKLIAHPEQYGIGWLMQKAMKVQQMNLKQSTAQILQGLKLSSTSSAALAGVFMTHLHIDHISGMPDIPNQLAVYVGKMKRPRKIFSMHLPSRLPTSFWQGRAHCRNGILTVSRKSRVVLKRLSISLVMAVCMQFLSPAIPLAAPRIWCVQCKVRFYLWEIPVIPFGVGSIPLNRVILPVITNVILAVWFCLNS